MTNHSMSDGSASRVIWPSIIRILECAFLAAAIAVTVEGFFVLRQVPSAIANLNETTKGVNDTNSEVRAEMKQNSDDLHGAVENLTVSTRTLNTDLEKLGQIEDGGIRIETNVNDALSAMRTRAAALGEQAKILLDTSNDVAAKTRPILVDVDAVVQKAGPILEHVDQTTANTEEMTKQGVLIATDARTGSDLALERERELLKPASLAKRFAGFLFGHALDGIEGYWYLHNLNGGKK